MSVKVVKKTVEERAGSIPALVKPSGSKMPEKAAISILHIIAKPNMIPK